MVRANSQQDSIDQIELDPLPSSLVLEDSTPHGLLSHSCTPPGSPRTSTSRDLPKPRASMLSTRRRLLRKFHGGWRTGVALSTLGALIVLVINISLLLWITTNFRLSNDGIATVYEGSCKRKTKISIWCHLAINICSTLLLSASNNAMQCLSAPTRADVNSAHSRGVWLDIGIPSFKNLRTIGWKRVPLWAVLGLSSLPLHLL